MEPVVIDIGRRDTRRALIAGPIIGVLGVVALVGAISAYADGEPVGGTIALVIGVVFTGIALLVAVAWKSLSRPRALVFEAQGVRWDDPQGSPWAVAWSELGAVSVSRTRQRAFVLASYLTRKTMVRLDLFPSDPVGFRARNPNMERLWEFHTVRNGYRLPLGDGAKLIPVIEQGMRQFAPHLYRGVRDEGFTVGLR
jgi:hypothetical protein